MLNKEEIKSYILDTYGIFSDSRPLYSSIYNKYIRAGGLWQQPIEITELIYFLQDKDIKTFLNIGTFNGATVDCLINLLPSITTAITIDPINHKIEYTNKKCLYLNTTSNFLSNLSFDLVFIDGDHSYHSTKNDFDNVGRFAKYCIFHDIDDNFITATLDGGCTKFWQDIKSQFNYIECIANDKPCKNMGIGIIQND